MALEESQGQGRAPLWGSEEEPGARSGILVALSDVRVDILEERRALLERGM